MRKPTWQMPKSILKNKILYVISSFREDLKTIHLGTEVLFAWWQLKHFQISFQQIHCYRMCTALSTTPLLIHGSDKMHSTWMLVRHWETCQTKTIRYCTFNSLQWKISENSLMLFELYYLKIMLIFWNLGLKYAFHLYDIMKSRWTIFLAFKTHSLMTGKKFCWRL